MIGAQFFVLLLFAPIAISSAWVLVFNDEFEGTELNDRHWNVNSNWTHGDQELQLYLAENVQVRNGTLVITTQRKEVMYGEKKYNFTSGWVDSMHKYKKRFGRWSIRAKLPNPAVAGIWPAIWMKPEPNDWNCWPTGGEIDIMEMTGHELNNTVYGTYHYGANCTDDSEHGSGSSKEKAVGVMAGTGTPCTCGCGCDLRSGPNGDYHPNGDGSAVVDFSQDFHVFSVEWTAKTIKWFVDDELYWERSSNRESGQPKVPIPSQPFYLILNTAIDWWTAGTGEGPLPVELIIDWVRVYALGDDLDGDGDSDGTPPAKIPAVVAIN